MFPAKKFLYYFPFHCETITNINSSDSFVRQTIVNPLKPVSSGPLEYMDYTEVVGDSGGEVREW